MNEDHLLSSYLASYLSLLFLYFSGFGCFRMFDCCFEGVGLGLSLVKTSVELLGGSIEVKSEKEKGSLFTILIPTALEKLQAKRILIVDADKGIQVSLEESFKKQGYFCSSLNNPESVIHEMPDIKPELIMLDVGGPERRGFTLLEEAVYRACACVSDH